MDKVTIYKWTSNLFLVATVIVFWFSLRDSTLNKEATLIALVLCAIGFLFDYLFKKEKKKHKDNN